MKEPLGCYRYCRIFSKRCSQQMDGAQCTVFNTLYSSWGLLHMLGWIHPPCSWQGMDSLHNQTAARSQSHLIQELWGNYATANSGEYPVYSSFLWVRWADECWGCFISAKSHEITGGVWHIIMSGLFKKAVYWRVPLMGSSSRHSEEGGGGGLQGTEAVSQLFFRIPGICFLVDLSISYLVLV